MSNRLASRSIVFDDPSWIRRGIQAQSRETSFVSVRERLKNSARQCQTLTRTIPGQFTNQLAGGRRDALHTASFICECGDPMCEVEQRPRCTGGTGTRTRARSELTRAGQTEALPIRCSSSEEEGSGLFGVGSRPGMEPDEDPVGIGHIHVPTQMAFFKRSMRDA